jgi:hypothetical protein
MPWPTWVESLIAFKNNRLSTVHEKRTKVKIIFDRFYSAIVDSGNYDNYSNPISSYFQDAILDNTVPYYLRNLHAAIDSCKYDN